LPQRAHSDDGWKNTWTARRDEHPLQS